MRTNLELLAWGGVYTALTRECDRQLHYLKSNLRIRSRSRNSKVRPLIIIVSLFLTALVATGAQAHAHLDHASPAVGATVPTAPRDITLWFTQNLEALFSTVEVFDGSGGRVDEGKPNINGNSMRVALKPLSPGTYRVHWHALSVDTHTTEGTFTFQVGGAQSN